MNLAYDRFRLHAYVDGELTPDEVADFERQLSQDPDAMSEVAALRAQNNAMHARYDSVLTSTSNDRVARLYRNRWSWPASASSRGALGLALAATVLVACGIGLAAGWMVRGRADGRELIAANELRSALAGGKNPSVRGSSERDVEGRLQSFVQTAALSHAVFVPEVRHPVEVAAADEAHLVTWLSKRLAAPLVVPHLGDSGWELLGGRLLPGENGPVAQFMYQDNAKRRMTLAVSKSVAGNPALKPTSAKDDDAAPATAAFRIAEENGNTVFYWIDTDYAYALTGKLSKSEMTAIASRVYRQLDRNVERAQSPTR
jgi:anti-sigma factor RsiW